MLSRLKTALRTLIRKSEVERELDEELRHHIEQQPEQNMLLGMNCQQSSEPAYIEPHIHRRRRFLIIPIIC